MPFDTQAALAAGYTPQQVDGFQQAHPFDNYAAQYIQQNSQLPQAGTAGAFAPNTPGAPQPGGRPPLSSFLSP
jgi:hypothetical protein